MTIFIFLTSKSSHCACPNRWSSSCTSNSNLRLQHQSTKLPEMPSNSTESSVAQVKLSVGSVVAGRWEVIKRVGEGGCGVVYSVMDRRDRTQMYALKVEPLQRRKEDEILKMEVFVLNKLKCLPSEHVVRKITCGRAATYSYMVMTLVDENLGALRRNTPHQHFTLSTAIRLARQCLQAIRDVQKGGFTHRDIKPANFALGKAPSQRRTVFLLDFGLSRAIYTTDKKTKTQKLREARSDVPFRGTLRYCSLNVHLRREQSRADDVQSWLYMVVEFIRGHLPWRCNDKKGVQLLKTQILDATLYDKCPEELVRIQQYLRRVEYKDEPDYAWMDQVLKQVMTRKRITWAEPYDWEQGGRFHDSQGSTITTSEQSDDDKNQREESDNGEEHTERDIQDMPDDSIKDKPA